MSKATLPNRIDPRRAADQNVSYEHCNLPLSRLDRLSSYLVNSNGNVQVNLLFGIDNQNQRYLEGTAEVEVEMLCQRCLEPVQLELNAKLSLGIVVDEEAAKNLPEHYDPMVIEKDQIDPADVVEDELILTLPIIPLHSSCHVTQEFGDTDAEEPSDNTDNPFSILAQLKSKKH